MDKDTKAKLLLILYFTVCGLVTIGGILFLILYQPERCHDAYGKIIECKTWAFGPQIAD